MLFLPYVSTCLRALRAYASDVPTCLRASNYYVPTCLKLLRASNCYVPTCLRAYVPSFFTCLGACMRIYIFYAYVPLCLKLFRTYVCSFFKCLRAYNRSQNILSFTSILCIAVFFWVIRTFIPFKTSKQTPASKTAYPNPGFFYLVHCIHRNKNLKTH